MGATRIIIPGSAPLGCFPYMLTARATNNPAAYDSLGCLKDVNNLMVSKNNDLQEAIKGLIKKFPKVSIYYGAFDEGVLAVLRQTSKSGTSCVYISTCLNYVILFRQ